MGAHRKSNGSRLIGHKSLKYSQVRVCSRPWARANNPSPYSSIKRYTPMDECAVYRYDIRR